MLRRFVTPTSGELVARLERDDLKRLTTTRFLNTQQYSQQ